MSAEAALAGAVARAIQTCPESNQWVVAFSGGQDSTVLLHALSQHTEIMLRAVHVDHGLQPELRGEWLQSVQSIAHAFGVPLTVLPTPVALTAGSSVEAEARHARYRALADSLGAGEVLVTAQHADDQAETVFLQMLRGSGPAGLSAMPARSAFGHGHLLRPLLDVPKSTISDYATRHDLRWFDDPSNVDTRFDRNYLRLHVMPGIADRWPAVWRTLGRVARWQQAATHALTRQALSDWQQICRPRRQVASCARLQVLPDGRAREAIRAGLAAAGLTVPNAVRLDAVLAMVNSASGKGLVAWDGGCARRYRDQLFLLAPLQAEPDDFDQFWDGIRPLRLPGGYGMLRLHPAPSQSLALRCHFREPGLKVRESSGNSKDFAKWCQERAIPPWARSRIPLISVEDTLIAIGGKRLSDWHKVAGSVVPIWSECPALGLSGSTGSGIV